MALKTFNLDAKVYGEFSKHCKKRGISMSKRVENFIKQEMIRIKSGDLDEFKLEIEKDTRPKMILPSPKLSDEHPMGKYC
ncbi:hypothetical protein AUJ84_03315 [Candidatus Pacearchaeota archaeon CG1_02_32_132]|nr:MAG: hypothetical protein AUJ84_03315 [Candidatus Pacearchaeota archaeon CG1_02_32_132]